MNSNSQTRILEQADWQYAGRDDIANVMSSVELLRHAEDHYEIAWRLGRAFFFLGQETHPAAEKRNLHAEGAQAARRAVTHLPNRVEGHFWLGVNLALLAQLEPPLKAARHALQAKRALGQAIRIDAAYHSAGALRVLARLQHKLPRFLGGGLPRARANFERAISLAPRNTVTRIYFAELLLETGAVTRARAELQAVLTVPRDPEWAFEIKRDQRLAEELIRKCAAP